MRHTFLALIALLTLLTGCAKKEQPVKDGPAVKIEAGNIKVVAVEKSDGADEIRAILERDKAKIDSIKSPVLGEAAMALEVMQKAYSVEYTDEELAQLKRDYSPLLYETVKSIYEEKKLKLEIAQGKTDIKVAPKVAPKAKSCAKKQRQNMGGSPDVPHT